jgi:hypothetical protein
MPVAIIIGLVVLLLIIITVGLFLWLRSDNTSKLPDTPDVSIPIPSQRPSPPSQPPDTSISDPPPPINSTQPTISSTPEPPQAAVSTGFAGFAPQPPALDSAGVLAPSTLKSGQTIKSPDGKITLTVTTGNLSGRMNGKNWFLDTKNTLPRRNHDLTIRSDGQLVLVDSVSGKVSWQSNTGGRVEPPYRLFLLNQGLLSISDGNGTAIWSSHH